MPIELLSLCFGFGFGSNIGLGQIRLSSLKGHFWQINKLKSVEERKIPISAFNSFICRIESFKLERLWPRTFVISLSHSGFGLVPAVAAADCDTQFELVGGFGSEAKKLC